MSRISSNQLSFSTIQESFYRFQLSSTFHIPRVQNTQYWSIEKSTFEHVSDDKKDRFAEYLVYLESSERYSLIPWLEIEFCDFGSQVRNCESCNVFQNRMSPETVRSSQNGIRGPFSGLLRVFMHQCKVRASKQWLQRASKFSKSFWTSRMQSRDHSLSLVH